MDRNQSNTDARYPDVQVQLSGTDGNVFAIIGRVAAALRRAGEPAAATAFCAAAFRAGSYDAVLRLCLATVDVR